VRSGRRDRLCHERFSTAANRGEWSIERGQQCSAALHAQFVDRAGFDLYYLRHKSRAIFQPSVGFSLQARLGGVSVQVSSGNKTANAIPIFVGTNQVNAILPGNTSTGTAMVTVTYNGQPSNGASFQVAGNSFGIFTIGSTGFGVGIITDAKSQLYDVNSSAHPNDFATIWGTGLGASPRDDGSAAPPQMDMPNLALSVYVGTQKATVTYRGRSVFTGEDQINFVVPSGITDCYVPVAVQIGNIVSNFVTMPIASVGQSCPDPLIGFISLGPPPATGSVTLTRRSMIGTSSSTTDSGEGYFGPPMLLNHRFHRCRQELAL
jgi:uncharacterized protein (TIGR03437 family)